MTGFVYVANTVFRSSLLRVGLWICLVHGDPNRSTQPSGITADDNDLLYATENDNHCISIFTTSGEFIHCFGEKGKKEGQFNAPKELSLNTYGYLYVSDMCNSWRCNILNFVIFYFVS